MLGPLIFLLYVNDKQEDLEWTLTLFADDVLLYHRTTCETATTALQRDLDELGSWAESWQMVYNPSKCYKMSVYRSNSPVLKDYKLFNQVLSSVQQHPDLGILLSDDLRGNSHVNKIVREANSTLGFVKRNLHFCSEETKRSASFRICLCFMGSLPARSNRQDLSGPETSSTIYQKR